MSIFDVISNQLHNQIVGGGLVLMVSGSVIALCRKVPTEIWAWIKRQVTINADIQNTDPLFDYLTLWLDSQPYTKKSRRLTVTTTTTVKSDDDDDDDQPSRIQRGLKLIFSPAPGSHFFLYKKTMVWLDRRRESNSVKDQKETGFKKMETITITTLGRNQKIIRDLMEDISKLALVPTENIRLYTSSFGYWSSSGQLKPRKIESVILPYGMAEDLVKDARWFLDAEEWYASLGIPWHRGYLFHGVPGSGKTSVVTALAGELMMDLYLLNLSTSGMDDERLSSLLGRVRNRTIVLMEDVDCTLPDRDGKHGRVTMSGLLNCLDGVQSRHGCMIFMTTNHRNKLDSALVRPGRVDVSFEFHNATDDQIRRLAARIAPELDVDFVVQECHNRTMAEVQQWLVRSIRQDYQTEGVSVII